MRQKPNADMEKIQYLMSKKIEKTKKLQAQEQEALNKYNNDSQEADAEFIGVEYGKKYTTKSQFKTRNTKNVVEIFKKWFDGTNVRNKNAKQAKETRRLIDLQPAITKEQAKKANAKTRNKT